MFELYILSLVVWWVAMIAAGMRRDQGPFVALVFITLCVDVLMGITFLCWVTVAPIFQEMSQEAYDAIGTHFFLPLFAPQVFAVLVFIVYVGYESKKRSSINP